MLRRTGTRRMIGRIFYDVYGVLVLLMVSLLMLSATAQEAVTAPSPGQPVTDNKPLSDNKLLVDPAPASPATFPSALPVPMATPPITTTEPAEGNTPPAAPVVMPAQPSASAEDATAIRRSTREQRLRERQKKEAELQQQIDQLRDETALEIGAAPTTLSEKFYALLDKVAGFATYNFRDEKNPLTVSMILISLGVIFLGILVSRFIATWVRRTVFSHVKDLNEHAATAVEKILYYFLVVSFVVFGLQYAGIPLTSFTFLGGAVAIGVGFGAQNLINNFISGLILLIERPIKLNDIVEVDGECGRVITIGARCSQIRLAKGIDVILPNSAFLEKKVVNWTLSDPRVRYAVRAGVTCKTPARDASDLIEKAVSEHPSILKTPVPKVLLIESGENEFIFEAYFWVNVTPALDGRVICSDIRYRIDELFREAGMVSAAIAAIRDAKSPVG